LNADRLTGRFVRDPGLIHGFANGGSTRFARMAMQEAAAALRAGVTGRVRSRAL